MLKAWMHTSTVAWTFLLFMATCISRICDGTVSKVYDSLPPTTSCVRTSPFLGKEEASMFVYSIRTKRAVDCSERVNEPANCDNERSCECHKVSCTTEEVREELCAGHPCPVGQECYLKTPCPKHYAKECTEVVDCITNLCANWGTCWNYTSAVNQYKCDCHPGFQGGHCETAEHEGKSRGGDIVFVVDSSGSNAESVQLEQRQYMRDFLAKFIVGPADFQAALVTFSFTASVHCHLNTHADNVSILAEVDQLPYVGGPSYLGKALQMVYEVVMVPARGLRPVMGQYVIVLSDGMTSDPVQTDAYAGLLKKAGAQVYSVMFGPAIDHQQLKTIVSNSSRIFSSSTLDAAYTVAAQHSPYCIDCVWSTADVVVLFDATIPTYHFNLAIDTLLKLVQGLYINVDHVPISYIRYAADVYEEFAFTTYTTKAEVLSHFSQRREQYHGPANHTRAIEHVTRTGFDSSKGARSDARHLVVLFTQGHYEDEGSVQAAAAELKSSGVWLATVGVGNAANAASVVGLASEPAVGFIVGTDVFIADDIVEAIISIAHYYTCL